MINEYTCRENGYNRGDTKCCNAKHMNRDGVRVAHAI